MKIEQIREDLKEVRAYYTNKDMFDYGNSIVPAREVLKIVNKYNECIKGAPSTFYLMYVGLYLRNYTVPQVAEYLNYSEDYIRQNLTKLFIFFQKQLLTKKEEKL